MCGSARPPLTSLTSRAPASRASSATEARMVSTLTGTPARDSSVMTGSTRRTSSPAEMRCAPGRVASPADVDEVRPLGGEFQPVRHRGVGPQPLATVGERVRGDVDDPHDQAARLTGEPGQPVLRLVGLRAAAHDAKPSERPAVTGAGWRAGPGGAAGPGPSAALYGAAP